MPNQFLGGTRVATGPTTTTTRCSSERILQAAESDRSRRSVWRSAQDYPRLTLQTPDSLGRAAGRAQHLGPSLNALVGKPGRQSDDLDNRTVEATFTARHKKQQSARHRGVFRVREAAPALMRELPPTVTVTFATKATDGANGLVSVQTSMSDGKVVDAATNIPCDGRQDYHDDTANASHRTRSNPHTNRSSNSSSNNSEARSERAFRLPPVVEGATGDGIDANVDARKKSNKFRRRRQRATCQEEVDRDLLWHPSPSDAGFRLPPSSSSLLHQLPLPPSSSNLSGWRDPPTQVKPVMLCRNDRVFRPKMRIE